MQLFGTDLLKTYWAHDVKMTLMRRYVASTSLRRHVPAGNLPPPPCPPTPQYSKPWPPNILNLPTPMSKFNTFSAIPPREKLILSTQQKLGTFWSQERIRQLCPRYSGPLIPIARPATFTFTEI